MKHIFLVAVTMLLLTATAANAQLSPVEQSRFDQLKSSTLKDWTNVDLAAYLKLREKDDSRPDGLNPLSSASLKFDNYPPEGDKSKYLINSLFLYETVALACAKDWEQFMAIWGIMQFKDGDVQVKNLVERDILHWFDNNSDYFEDVTTKLGAPTVAISAWWDASGAMKTLYAIKDLDSFEPDKVYEQSKQVTQIAFGDLMGVTDKLKPGDILLQFRHENAMTRSVAFVLDKKRATDGVTIMFKGGPKPTEVRPIENLTPAEVQVFRAKPDIREKLRAKADLVKQRLELKPPEYFDEQSIPLVNIGRGNWFMQPRTVLMPNRGPLRPVGVLPEQK